MQVSWLWFLSSDEGGDDDDGTVVLFAVGRGEAVDAVHDLRDGLARRFLGDAGGHEAVFDALDAELFAIRVFRFVDAVREHDDRHFRAELGVERVVFGKLGREKAEAGAVRVDASDMVPDVQDELGMSGACVFERILFFYDFCRRKSSDCLSRKIRSLAQGRHSSPFQL